MSTNQVIRPDAPVTQVKVLYALPPMGGQPVPPPRPVPTNTLVTVPVPAAKSTQMHAPAPIPSKCFVYQITLWHTRHFLLGWFAFLSLVWEITQILNTFEEDIGWTYYDAPTYCYQMADEETVFPSIMSVVTPLMMLAYVFGCLLYMHNRYNAFESSQQSSMTYYDTIGALKDLRRNQMHRLVIHGTMALGVFASLYGLVWLIIMQEIVSAADVLVCLFLMSLLFYDFWACYGYENATIMGQTDTVKWHDDADQIILKK